MKRLRGKPAVLLMLILSFLMLAVHTHLRGESENHAHEHHARTMSFHIDDPHGEQDDETKVQADGLDRWLSSLANASWPEPALSERTVHYDIHVYLDEKEMKLIGRQLVVWTHPGRLPVHEVYFHAYPNAFESKKTSFMRESGGKLRQDKMPKGGYGHMNIGRIVYSRYPAGQTEKASQENSRTSWELSNSSHAMYSRTMEIATIERFCASICRSRSSRANKPCLPSTSPSSCRLLSPEWASSMTLSWQDNGSRN